METIDACSQKSPPSAFENRTGGKECMRDLPPPSLPSGRGVWSSSLSPGSPVNPTRWLRAAPPAASRTSTCRTLRPGNPFLYECDGLANSPYPSTEILRGRDVRSLSPREVSGAPATSGVRNSSTAASDAMRAGRASRMQTHLEARRGDDTQNGRSRLISGTNRPTARKLATC